MRQPRKETEGAGESMEAGQSTGGINTRWLLFSLRGGLRELAVAARADPAAMDGVCAADGREALWWRQAARRTHMHTVSQKQLEDIAVLL